MSIYETERRPHGRFVHVWFRCDACTLRGDDYVLYVDVDDLLAAADAMHMCGGAR